MLMNYQAQVLSISHDRMKPLIFFFTLGLPLLLMGGEDPNRFFFLVLLI